MITHRAAGETPKIHIHFNEAAERKSKKKRAFCGEKKDLKA